MPNKEAIILDHVANVFQFGLPWIDRKWTLEGKKKKKKKEKDEEDISTWTCKKCYYVWAKEEGRECPDCGEEIPLSERDIKLIEQLRLIEITEKDHIIERKQEREKFKKIQEAKGYKKGWIWHQMQLFDEKYEKKIEKLRNGIL